MIFSHLIQSFVLGLILILFLLTPTMGDHWVPSLDFCPIIPKKYHFFYYLIVSFLYLASITYFWNENNVEYVIGLSVGGALCIWRWCVNTIYARNAEKKFPLAEQDSNQSSESDTFEYKIIGYCLIAWFFIWIGTLVEWKDYSYYIFLRIVGTIIALIMMEISYESSKFYLPIFIAIGVIINPIIPFRFERGIWHVIDLVILFTLFIFYFKIKRIRKSKRSTSFG